MQKYLKAIWGAAIAGLGAASTAYAQGNGHIGWVAAIAIAITTLTALGGVWSVTNAGAGSAK